LYKTAWWYVISILRLCCFDKAHITKQLSVDTYIFVVPVMIRTLDDKISPSLLLFLPLSTLLPFLVGLLSILVYVELLKS